METTTSKKILRIYLSNTDKIKHEAAYEYIAYAARKYGMAGVTVFKGILGYGASCKISSEKFWSITEKYPVRMEIIDTEEKIKEFIETIKPDIDEMPKGCLITVIDTEVILLKKGGK